MNNQTIFVAKGNKQIFSFVKSIVFSGAITLTGVIVSGVYIPANAAAFNFCHGLGCSRQGSFTINDPNNRPPVGTITFGGNTYEITGFVGDLPDGTNTGILLTKFDEIDLTLNPFSPPGPVYQANIRAVPEPLTILGSITAAGFGAGFKRKLAKSQKDKKD